MRMMNNWRTSDNNIWYFNESEFGVLWIQGGATWKYNCCHEMANGR